MRRSAYRVSHIEREAYLEAPTGSYLEHKIRLDFMHESIFGLTPNRYICGGKFDIASQ